MDTQNIIDELQSTHALHLKKLTELHETELANLRTQLQNSRQQVAELQRHKTELAESVAGMQREVGELRGAFELVQGRLSRILVDQDDLVRLIQLNNKEQDKEKEGDKESRTVSSSNPSNSSNSPITSRDLKEIELHLKAQVTNDKDEAVQAALQALKYFKKLEASDPIHLSRLLEIPFSLDRSFALSSSLLSCIAVHMNEDPKTKPLFDKFPLYSVFLNEIVQLHQEVNELSRLYLMKTKVGDLERKLTDKMSISKWLIEEGSSVNSGNGSGVNVTTILSSFLSNFK